MVFLPLHDDNKLQFIPFQAATWSLIAVNVAVFIWQQTMGEDAVAALAFGAGVIPGSLFGDTKLPEEFVITRPEVTLLTYMFLHGDIWHLIGNMMFLWVFGDNVEDAMGSLKFILFYLLCGVAAGLAHVLANLGSEAPLIGASGATAGIIGAYIMLYPRVRVWILAFTRIPLRLAAWFVILAWILVQVALLFFQSDGMVALWAHIGGFVAGIALIPLFKRPDHPLFAAGRPK
jgi:membrane associated rhomboid family serine protease